MCCYTSGVYICLILFQCDSWVSPVVLSANFSDRVYFAMSLNGSWMILFFPSKQEINHYGVSYLLMAFHMQNSWWPVFVYNHALMQHFKNECHFVIFGMKFSCKQNLPAYFTKKKNNNNIFFEIQNFYFDFFKLHSCSVSKEWFFLFGLLQGIFRADNAV